MEPFSVLAPPSRGPRTSAWACSPVVTERARSTSRRGVNRFAFHLSPPDVSANHSPCLAQSLAAAFETSLFAGITRILAVTKELDIGHDRLFWVVHLPVSHVGFVVGDADHEPGGAD